VDGIEWQYAKPYLSELPSAESPASARVDRRTAAKVAVVELTFTVPRYCARGVAGNRLDVRRLDRGQHLDFLVAQRRGLEGGWGLHGDEGNELQQVVLEHVPQHANAVVVAGAVLQAHFLGHGNLHVIDVVAVPEWLKDGVGEARNQDVLNCLLFPGNDRCGIPGVLAGPMDLAFRLCAEARSMPKGFSITTRRQPFSSLSCPDLPRSSMIWGNSPGGVAM
jgi:hypothetical protein